MMFILSIVLLVFYYACMMVLTRIPVTHDAFQYFTLQYYFLNHMYSHGEYAHWMPYMTLGTVASWWFSIQAGFVQNALMLFAKGLNASAFLGCFYAGMFFDELILMLGCWLWGRRYLNNNLSVAFFSLMVWASSLWLTQPWYNLHSYYCLPLILHFLHSFLETGRWRYFLAGVHLVLMQTLGNLPYFFPVMSLVVFLYFFFYALFHGEVMLNFFRCVRINAKVLWVLLILALTGYLIYQVTGFGTQEIVRYIGRESDGTSTLTNYLMYGGEQNFRKWQELFFGFTPQMDYHLYGGVIVAPLLVWVFLFGLSKRLLPVIIVIALLLDFSVGGLTAVAAYHLWPLMKFYRHLALVSPITKIFVFLLAAVGFDWFVSQSFRAEHHKKVLPAFLPGAGLMILAFWQYSIVSSGSLLAVIKSMIVPGRPYLDGYIQAMLPFVNDRVFWVSVLTVASACAWGWWALSGRQETRRITIVVIFLLHLVDVCAYKAFETSLRSEPLGAHARLLDFQKMPFVLKRELPDDWQRSHRALLIKLLPWWPQGVHYWSDDSFLFRDAAGHPFRTDHWLFPLDQFMRAYWSQHVNDRRDDPLGLRPYCWLYLPLESGSATKMAGLSEEKVQFFSYTLVIPDEELMASVMLLPFYEGDIPLVLDRSYLTPNLVLHLKDKARFKADYYITHFSADRLKISVQSDRKGWLYYSEVWHPNWRATVNGRPVKVQRTNLAFQMVPIEEGKNDVVFSFQAGWITLAQIVLSVFSLVWVVLISVMSYQAITTPRRENDKDG